MTLIKIPLIIIQLIAILGLVIMFVHFKEVSKKTPFFMQPLMWILNLSGFIYALYGLYIKEHFIFKSGLTLIAVSYGIWFSFILDKLEKPREKQKDKNG
mgnify:CR=1 FL=1